MSKLLEIKDLHAYANDKEILKGLNLVINAGETHVIMGPNGAGKSTLLNSILSNPSYTKTGGEIFFDGKNITSLKTDEIARDGIFMSFQSPEEIAGISVFNFIKTAKTKQQDESVDFFELKEEVANNMKELNMTSGMEKRDLNVGFSGGEKKKNEILQMLELKPKLAMLDETDSGLDVDAIKIVSKGIDLYKNNENALLIITHSTKILEYLKVDFVHILIDGKIVFTGDGSLAKTIEKEGYAFFKEKANG